MITVTATELTTNMGKYLDMVEEYEDIYVTRNGREVARLTAPSVDRLSILNSLVGIIPADAETDRDTIRDERLARQ